jgi:TPR repeat protein
MDKIIANERNPIIKQSMRCEKAVTKSNRHKDGSLEECLTAVRLLQGLPNSNSNKNRYLGDEAYNAGIIYYFAKDNKIKAYEYWYLAAKLGNKSAQENLGIMCQDNPWVCK